MPPLSRGEVTIYRQLWTDGKLLGTPQVALKLPFAFPLNYGGNAYYFSRDLSTIVYARPGGHADLYLMSHERVLLRWLREWGVAVCEKQIPRSACLPQAGSGW